MIRLATELLARLCRKVPFLRAFVWKRIYDFMATNYPAEACSCLNYGYAARHENGANDIPILRGEPERYCLQLYHYVASGVPVPKGKDILEVGSGRGGGARFLKKFLDPRLMAGVDFSQPALVLSGKSQCGPVFFMAGEAERLPVADRRFDVVVNIESSHCYGSLERFFREVRRVLRPQGHFLYADFCPAGEFAARRELLHKSGLLVLAEDDITGNVVAALEKDRDRRLALIEEYVDPSLRASFCEFAGIPQSQIYREFETRRKIYFRFVAVRPEGPHTP